MSGVNEAQWLAFTQAMATAAHKAKTEKALGASKAESPDDYLEQIALDKVTPVSKPLSPLTSPSLSSGSPLQNPLIIKGAYDDVEVVPAEKVQEFVSAVMISKKEPSLRYMWTEMTEEVLTKFLYTFPGIFRFLEKIFQPESGEVRFGVLPVKDRGINTEMKEINWNAAGASNFANTRRSLMKYYRKNNRHHPAEDEPLYLVVVIDMTNRCSLIIAITDFQQGREVTYQLTSDRLSEQFICIPGGDGRANNMKRFFDSFTSLSITNAWPLFSQSKYKISDSNSIFSVDIRFKYSIQKTSLVSAKNKFDSIIEAARSMGIYLTFSFTPGVEIANADQIDHVAKAIDIREKLIQRFDNVRVLVTSKVEESFVAYLETPEETTSFDILAKRAYQKLPSESVKIHLARKGSTTFTELVPPANPVRRKFLI